MKDSTPRAAESPERLISCPLCEKLGKSTLFRRISPQHLANRHDITMKDFRRDYPNAPLTSIASREANRRQWANPKTRARRINSLKEAAARPDVRKSHSAGMKRALRDPHKKQRILDGVRRANADPLLVQRRINALRKALAKPQVRRRFSAARKRDWQNPEVRAKLVKHVRNIWADRKRKLDEAERLPVVGKILLALKSKPVSWQLIVPLLLLDPSLSNAKLQELTSTKQTLRQITRMRTFAGVPGPKGRPRKKL